MDCGVEEAVAAFLCRITDMPFDAPEVILSPRSGSPDQALQLGNAIAIRLKSGLSGSGPKTIKSLASCEPGSDSSQYVPAYPDIGPKIGEPLTSVNRDAVSGSGGKFLTHFLDGRGQGGDDFGLFKGIIVDL
jgi:hypothetical protein